MWIVLQNLIANAENFFDVFHRMWQQLNTQQLVMFAMITWSIWKKRNLQLWKNITETVTHVLGRAQGTLQACQHSR
jgi:hypothetical protein